MKATRRISFYVSNKLIHKARCGSPKACAVAKAIANTGRVDSVLVMGESATVKIKGKTFTALLPTRIQNFIAKFDDSKGHRGVALAGTFMPSGKELKHDTPIKPFKATLTFKAEKPANY